MIENLNFPPFVDELTPIGRKWQAVGGSSALGTVNAKAQSMPDGIGSYQEFATGTVPRIN
jgi:hypothetical protein